MDKTEAMALIKRCEDIRDGKGPDANFAYPAGPPRAAIDAQIEGLKEKVKKYELSLLQRS